MLYIQYHFKDISIFDYFYRLTEIALKQQLFFQGQE